MVRPPTLCVLMPSRKRAQSFVFFSLVPLQATISYGQQLDAEQLMVQYGFPEPSNVNLARPLMDPRLFRDRTTSGEKRNLLLA